jgi:WD40 repeat protein
MMVLGLANGEIQAWPLDKQGLPEKKATLKWQIKPGAYSSGYSEPELIKRMSFGVNDHQLLTMSGYGDLTIWDVTNATIQRSVIQPTVTPYASSTPNPTEIISLTETPTFAPTPSPTSGPIREATPFLLPIPAADAISPETLNNLHRQYELQQGLIFSSVWSPDGDTLAVAGAKGLWLYNAKDWSLRNTLSEGSTVTSIAFSHSSNLIAYCLESHFIIVADLKNGHILHTLPSQCGSLTLGFTQADQILTSHYQWIRQAWNLKTGQLLVKGDQDFSITTSPDGKYSAYSISSGNGDSTAIKIVNNATGDIVQIIEKAGSASTSDQLLFSPDGSRLVVVRHGMYWIRTMALTTARYTDNDIQFWQVNSDQSFTLITTTTGMETNAFSFSPDGKILAIIHPDHDLELWDAINGRCIKQLPIQGTFVQFNPRRNQLLVLHEQQGVEVWQLKRDSAIRVWNLDGFGQQAEIAFSTDLLVASTGSEIKLWNLHNLETTNDPYKTIKTNYHIDAIAVSPDGRFLASNGEKGTIVIWDPVSGRQVLALSGHQFNYWTLDSEGFVYCLVYSPDGNILASAGSDRIIRLWRISDGGLLAEFGGIEADNLAFSPDGQLLADSGSEWITCMDGGCIPAHTDVEIWDVRQENLLRILDLAGRNNAFSPDAAMLVSINASSGDIQVFDVNTGKIHSTWKGNIGVTQVFFSANGKYLVTVCGQSLQFWEWNTGRLVATKDFQYPISQVKFSTDNRTLILSYANGVIELWKIEL